MSKKKLFIENILIYGLGGIINKIIPLLMVPVVTRIMPGSEYFGLNDLHNTIVSFASALAIMGLYDAMFRLFFEKADDNYKKSICSTTLFLNLLTTIFVCVLMFIFKDYISHYLIGTFRYNYLVYFCILSTFVNATNSIISAPTRMQNKRKIFLITNALAPILSYSISIPLLLKGYYVIALPLSGIFSCIILEITFYILNKDWFNFRFFDANLVKQLVPIALPLLPNFLIYWIFNSCDRIMISNMLGIADVGVYSVGSKLGLASQLIYTAFAGGWQFFAFSTMKEKNQVKTNSFIFEYLGIISFIMTMLICSISYMFHKILYVGSYINGYIVAPYLFLSPLLSMLFQIESNQFLIIKKTWPNMLILTFGAIVNILLNIFLIPKIGIEGASVATLIGYFVSVVVCSIVLISIKQMFIRFKFLICIIVMFIFFICWRFFFSKNLVGGLILTVGCSLLMVLLYIKDLKVLILDFLKKSNKKKC